MPVIFHHEAGNLYVQRISGVLNLVEFQASQVKLGSEIGAGVLPLVLVILENFEGWEKGADWSDIEFVLSEGSHIVKIAIVGEARWEVEAMAFAGAGYRSAPVKYFTPDQETQARAWLET